jgi:altronate dehydratase small subunit
MKGMKKRIDAIVIQEIDNVATALREIQGRERIIVGMGEKKREFLVHQAIPYGHKLATRNISKGEDIIKYGEIIGRAICDIPSGTYAHIQNIESLRGRGDLETKERPHGI